MELQAECDNEEVTAEVKAEVTAEVKAEVTAEVTEHDDSQIDHGEDITQPSEPQDTDTLPIPPPTKDYLYCMRMQGLPYSATKDSVADWIGGSVENADVEFIVGRDGRIKGEVLVGFMNLEEYTRNKARDRENFGQRYVETYESTLDDWRRLVVDNSKREEVGGDHFCIKLRGLPFSATKSDIEGFLKGVELKPEGIMLCIGRNGKPNGEAVVQCCTKEDQEVAISFDRRHMGSRYVEVFSVTYADYERSYSMNCGEDSYSHGYGMSREYKNMYNVRRNDHRASQRIHPYGPPPGSFLPSGQLKPGLDENGQYKHIVHLRGLLYNASDAQIKDFFAPLETIAIRILYEHNRPTGEADVSFSTHGDALSAMSKNKQHLGSRYVDLFLRSRPDDDFDDDYAWSGPNNMDMRRSSRPGGPIKSGRGRMARGGYY